LAFVVVTAVTHRANSTLVIGLRLNFVTVRATNFVRRMTRPQEWSGPMIGIVVAVVVAVLAIHAAMRASTVSTKTRDGANHRSEPRSGGRRDQQPLENLAA